jgi:hypothetical protein
MAAKLSVGALSGEGVTCSCGRIRTNGLLSGVTAEAINGRSINTIKPWMVLLNGYTMSVKYQNRHTLCCSCVVSGFQVGCYQQASSIMHGVACDIIGVNCYGMSL